MSINITDAAGGALDAQRLAFDIRHSVVPNGTLADRLRLVFLTERDRPHYTESFVGELEKAIAAGMRL